MQRVLEIILIIGLAAGSLFLLANFFPGPGLFSFVFPCAFLVFVFVNWLFLMFAVFRQELNYKNVWKFLVLQLGINILLIIAVQVRWPGHCRIVKAVYFQSDQKARENILRRASNKPNRFAHWAVWARTAFSTAKDARGARTPRHSLLTAVLIAAFAAPLMLAMLFSRSFVEGLLAQWSRNVFLRHQQRVASFLAEEERVGKAFLAAEGYSWPLKLLFCRLLLVIWTDRRIFLIRENRWNTVDIRSIPLVAIRAIRGKERFFGCVGIIIEFELLNRKNIRLWALSRQLGEGMGDKLANIVQQQQALRGVYDGPVVVRLCPYCFAEASKGSARVTACPSCGRRMGLSFAQRAVGLLFFSAVVLFIAAITTYIHRGTVSSMYRDNNGNLHIVGNGHLCAYNKKGRRIIRKSLPAGLAGADRTFIVAYPGLKGVLLGSDAGLWRWTGKSFSRISFSTSCGRIFGARSSASYLFVVCEHDGEWTLLKLSFSNLEKILSKRRMSILSVVHPVAFVGVMGKELLFSMKSGGVARYKQNGERKGWLIGSEETGLVLQGVVVGNEVRLVDIEELSPWTMSSERPDLVQTVARDGTITDTVSLGKRSLPLFCNAFTDVRGKAARPHVVCRGTGDTVLILDTTAGRLVEVRKGSPPKDVKAAKELGRFLWTLKFRRSLALGCFVLASFLLVLSTILRFMSNS